MTTDTLHKDTPAQTLRKDSAPTFTNADIVKLAMAIHQAKVDSGEFFAGIDGLKMISNSGLVVKAPAWNHYIDEAESQLQKGTASSDDLAKRAPSYSGQRPTSDQLKMISDIQYRRTAIRKV